MTHDKHQSHPNPITSIHPSVTKPRNHQNPQKINKDRKTERLKDKKKERPKTGRRKDRKTNRYQNSPIIGKSLETGTQTDPSQYT